MLQTDQVKGRGMLDVICSILREQRVGKPRLKVNRQNKTQRFYKKLTATATT